MRLRWFAVVLLLAVSTSCNRSDRPDEDPNSGPSSDAGPCALLKPKVVENLSGAQLDGTETTLPGSDLPSCAYGRLDEVGVQVTQAPAGEWARALPGVVDQLKAAGGFGDGSLLRQLEEGAELVERGETIAPAQACSLFSDMVALRDGIPGLHQSIAYLPGREDPQAITAQACIRGTFTSIVVGRPDLQVGSKVETAIEDALLRIA